MDEDDSAAILRLLDDEYARSILIATAREPMSAKQLSEECDASLPTVYRRVDDLHAHDLLTEHTKLDPEGNHFTVYESTVSSLTVEIHDDALSVEISKDEDVSDRFTQLWEDISDG